MELKYKVASIIWWEIRVSVCNWKDSNYRGLLSNVAIFWGERQSWLCPGCLDIRNAVS